MDYRLRRLGLRTENTFKDVEGFDILGQDTTMVERGGKIQLQ